MSARPPTTALPPLPNTEICRCLRLRLTSAGTSNWYPIITADERYSVFLVVKEDVPPDPISI